MVQTGSPNSLTNQGEEAGIPMATRNRNNESHFFSCIVYMRACVCVCVPERVCVAAGRWAVAGTRDGEEGEEEEDEGEEQITNGFTT